MRTGRKVAYLQYSNPATLPPLEHSALILQGAGYRVSFAGLVETNAAGSMTLPRALVPRARLWRARPPGWRQRWNYLLFIFNQTTRLAVQPRGWVYASDLFSCPLACLVKLLRLGRLIYHEHDSMSELAGRRGWVERVLLRLRAWVAIHADIVILPNRERARVFDRQRPGCPPAQVVWNCPRRGEAGPARTAWDGRVLRVLYHGSITPERLPLAVVEAVARFAGRVRLSVVGYFPVAVSGYADTLRDTARSLGAGECVDIKGTFPRAETLAFAATQDVGLAFMPTQTDDINMRHMTGASNKAFDYLAVGAALLMSEQPADWRAFYVDEGYGLACDPQNTDSIAAALQRFLDDPIRLRAMGEAGRQRVLQEWNYETTFAPVLREMDSLTDS